MSARPPSKDFAITSIADAVVGAARFYLKDDPKLVRAREAITTIRAGAAGQDLNDALAALSSLAVDVSAYFPSARTGQKGYVKAVEEKADRRTAGRELTEALNLFEAAVAAENEG